MKRLLFLIPTILTVTLLSLTLSTTQSSAKSYPEVISNRLSGGAATSRNFWANDSNAIYSKAGILPGARLVTSKSMLNSYKVGASTDKLLVHAAYTLRGYQTAKLSNGSYYMKVVSFNGKIRGWIYVGKTNQHSTDSKMSVVACSTWLQLEQRHYPPSSINFVPLRQRTLELSIPFTI